MRRDLEAQAGSQGYLVQVLTAVAMLKASGGEGAALERWSGLFGRQLEVAVRRGRISALVGSLLGSLQLFAPLVLLLVGARLVLAGELSLGSMLALQALAAAFLAPLSSLVASGQGLQLMGEGDSFRFWMPKELAYNDQPGRPAGMLVFDGELIDIKGDE